MPMTKVTMPSMAPTRVISRPLAHQERTVMRDLAAPTAKWAMSEMIAAQMTARIPVEEEEGNDGDEGPEGGGERAGEGRGDGVAEGVFGGVEALDGEGAQKLLRVAGDVFDHAGVRPPRECL